LAYALCHAAVVHELCREGRAAQAYAEAAMTLATTHADAQGFGMWWAMGTMLRGWALAEHGQGEAGIAHMRQGLAAWRAAGGARGAARGRDRCSSGARRGRRPAGEVAGTARGDRPQPAVAAAGQARRSAPTAGGDVSVVHRGLGPRRPAGGAGTP